MNPVNSMNNIVTFGVIYEGKLLGDRYTDFNKLLSDIRSFSESILLNGYETFVIFAVHKSWFKQTFPKRLQSLYYGEDWQKVYDNLIDDTHGFSEKDN